MPGLTDTRRGHGVLSSKSRLRLFRSSIVSVPTRPRLAKQAGITSFLEKKAQGAVSLTRRRKRLLSLSAQKFISDLSRDAFQYAKLRVNGTAVGRGRPAAGVVSSPYMEPTRPHYNSYWTSLRYVHRSRVLFGDLPCLPLAALMPGCTPRSRDDPSNRTGTESSSPWMISASLCPNTASTSRSPTTVSSP
jgi:hypothetical protein